MSHSLFSAAQTGDVALIKTLLDAGADPSGLDEAGETALMHAAHAGQLKAVQTLLAAGAASDFKSAQGWTALAKAAYNAETECGYPQVIAAPRR